MKRRFAGRSSPLPKMWSGPATSGSSSFSGTKTVPLPPFVILSRPWSKNWPKIVNSELNGGDRPTSVVMFSMNSVWCAGTQPAGRPSVPPGVVGSVVHATTGSAPCERTGKPAAATAAGLVEVWSTIRFEIVRGSLSTTLPLVCA